MNAKEEQERNLRYQKLYDLNKDIDWLIAESITERQIGELGMLLFIRGLKIIEATYGSKNVKEITEKVINEQLAKPSTSPRGWDSALSRWEYSDGIFDDDGEGLRG